eukprot:Hpha_TRINITY_DN22611_c0_g1::TRINITY_DN22611_c0_g1_i1::g.192687::m.192687
MIVTRARLWSLWVSVWWSRGTCCRLKAVTRTARASHGSPLKEPQPPSCLVRSWPATSSLPRHPRPCRIPRCFQDQWSPHRSRPPGASRDKARWKRSMIPGRLRATMMSFLTVPVPKQVPSPVQVPLPVPPLLLLVPAVPVRAAVVLAVPALAAALFGAPVLPAALTWMMWMTSKAPGRILPHRLRQGRMQERVQRLEWAAATSGPAMLIAMRIAVTTIPLRSCAHLTPLTALSALCASGESTLSGRCRCASAQLSASRTILLYHVGQEVGPRLLRRRPQRPELEPQPGGRCPPLHGAPEVRGEDESR